MSSGGELGEPAHPDERSAEQRALMRIEHEERVRAFATLKPREREALYLLGLGYSYREVAKLTQSSPTAINRRISEGRAALRRGGRKRHRPRPRRARREQADSGLVSSVGPRAQRAPAACARVDVHAVSPWRAVVR